MPIPASDICWQAVQESDSAYDGRFVFAVRTTRIYCRPSCPSRLPNRENVRFFALPTTAEAHGYRPCKRCDPARATAHDPQAKQVQAVCDYIDAHLDQSLTLTELGRIVHWSPYHLQRTFKEVMGITPRQYTGAQRIKAFKQALKAGESVTYSALTAGYSSSSRVYESGYHALGMTPTDYQQGADDITIAYATGDSPLGRLLVAMTDRGVCALEMGEDDAPLIERVHDEFPSAFIYDDPDYVQGALQAVLDYLAGWQPHIALPLDIRVTAFQQRVLDALQAIPYGETRTYGEIASAIGQPKASRAVGNACNRNPVPLIIPCHRVLGSNGKLTGYAFGLARKAHLLELEADHSADDKR
ncbi:MAG: bifunctional DNA-binding transcriptional regulator/O6-methylguanine-DNA methyltransferase Ada [Anaerolineae bacterium]